MTRNQLWGELQRGFKSLSLRHGSYQGHPGDPPAESTLSNKEDALYRLLSNHIADSTNSAFLLIGTDYRIQWVSETARKLLFKDSPDMTGGTCAHALQGRVCTAQCLEARENFSGNGPFGPPCMEKEFGDYSIRNSILEENGDPVGLLKQIFPSEETDPATGFPRLESRGSWHATLAPTLSRIAETTIPILLVGETGTGKEVLAQRIHELSPRKNNPFVVLDLSVVPETLIDDALFGHARGAFTGATSDYTGKLLEADGGTLLLDELENIPLSIQAKLLRFLETGVVERIGQTKKHSIDVRVIAATNISPDKLLASGRLREDLFYRLRGMTITLPPLRDRREEIPLLIQTFRGNWSARHGRKAPAFSNNLINAFCQYHYPGNIRELRHLVDLCLSLSTDPVVTESTMPDPVREILTSQGGRHQLASLPLQFSQPPGNVDEAVAAVEKDMIQRVLAQHRGRVSEAARTLSMSRITLWRKMKKYDLDRRKSFPS